MVGQVIPERNHGEGQSIQLSGFPDVSFAVTEVMG